MLMFDGLMLDGLVLDGLMASGCPSWRMFTKNLDLGRS